MESNLLLLVCIVLFVASLLGIASRLSKRTKRSLNAASFFALLAAIVSQGLEQPYWRTLLVLLGGAVVAGGLAIWWLTIWALRKEGRWGQFSLSSMIFLTVFAALFFGVVRWVAILIPRPTSHPPDASEFLVVAVCVLTLGVVSIPSVLAVNDALLWTGVRLVRRPFARRLLGRRPRPQGEPIERVDDDVS